MTTPKSNPYEALINAIEEMNNESVGTRQSIDGLATAVLAESAARDRKEKTLRKLLVVVVSALALLLLIAGLNLVNTTRTNDIAKDTQQTNGLLVGCFTPGSECQKQSQEQQRLQDDRLRQTTFVLFVCSRLNPIDPNNPDPQSDSKNLVTCVQQYYPNFKLPAKVK